MVEEQPGVARPLQLIQAEYRESPGLSLTKPQMQRLWGLDASECDAVLDALVGSRVLRRTLRGNYVLYPYAQSSLEWSEGW